jgi:hypothetical protein
MAAAIHFYTNNQPAWLKTPSVANLRDSGFTATQVTNGFTANSTRIKPPVTTRPKDTPNNPPRDNTRLNRKVDETTGVLVVAGYQS